MDVTTMPSTASAIESIIAEFPSITFTEGKEFRWSPEKRTVEFTLTDDHLLEHLLHEIAHAELGHRSYSRDIELISLERDAWRHARTALAPRFSLEIATEIIEDDLDTYRNWLHARSTCPKCGATGIQTGPQVYTCVSCRTEWRVNQAIGCGLRRYTKK